MRGNNPDAPDVRPPAWATCETCRWCNKSGDVFGQLDEDMRDKLMAKFGLCTDAAGEPVLVELSTPPASMACEGESWTLA